MKLRAVAERNNECMKHMVVAPVVVAVVGQVSALVDIKALQPGVVLEISQKPCFCSPQRASFF